MSALFYHQPPNYAQFNCY